MIKFSYTRNSRRIKKESVSDPHELLLSLVDMGSLDADELLLACVGEMSDAECKRVLNSLSLPECCDELDDEDPVATLPKDGLIEEPVDDTEEPEDDIEEPANDEIGDELDSEDTEEACSRKEAIERRIRRIERMLSKF